MKDNECSDPIHRRIRDNAKYFGDDVSLIGDIKLGKGAIIGDRVTIGHPDRSDIERSGHIMTNSRRTEIGDNLLIRSGSVIYEAANIGSGVQMVHSVIIREDSLIGDRVTLGNYSIVEFKSSIGSDTLLHSGVATSENCWIGKNVWISPHVVMTGGRLMLGAAVRAGTASREQLVADESQLIDGAYSVVIDDGARIGAGAVILSRVRVGEDAVIAAGAVVDQEIPPGVVAAGNPARVLRQL